jgi:hypothetical protein
MESVRVGAVLGKEQASEVLVFFKKGGYAKVRGNRGIEEWGLWLGRGDSRVIDFHLCQDLTVTPLPRPLIM